MVVVWLNRCASGRCSERKERKEGKKGEIHKKEMDRFLLLCVCVYLTNRCAYFKMQGEGEKKMLNANEVEASIVSLVS